MPIYEYHCDACDSVFEEWRRHADDITEVPCPACKKTAHRLISNTTFVLKGGGWYVTEYGNRKTGAPAPAADAGASAPAADTAASSTPGTETAAGSSVSGVPAASAAPAKPAPTKETATAAAS